MSKIGGLLLAAGLSSRMGEPKPLLEWNGKSLIEFHIDILNSLNIKPTIVLGFCSEKIIRKIRNYDVDIIVNSNYKSGKTSSIIKGLGAIPKVDDILLMSIDQPRPKYILEQLIKNHFLSGKEITIPKFILEDGSLRGGHPVILSSKILDEMNKFISKEKTIKDFILSNNSVNEVIFEDPLIKLDLNNKLDYFEGQKLFLKSMENGKK